MGSFVDAANAVASIGDLIALVRGSLSQDWSGKVAFTSRAKELHSAMLAIQCMIGGAKTPLRDLFGNEICPGGTKAVCTLPATTILEWRTLRDGFGQFWKAAAERDEYTNAEAQRLKDYATAFHNFYLRVERECSKQGVVIPSPSTTIEPQPQPQRGFEWGWVFAATGVAALAYLMLRGRR